MGNLSAFFPSGFDASKCPPERDTVIPGCEAAELLEQLFPGERVHLVAMVPDIGPRASVNVRSDDAAAIAQFIAANPRRNLYFTANDVGSFQEFKPSKPDVQAIRTVYCDLDPHKQTPWDEERRRIRQKIDDGIEPRPTAAVDSGNGVQLAWRLHEPLDPAEYQGRVEALGKRIGIKLGGDSVQNIDRLLRLPGTVNHPGKTKLEAGWGIAQATLLWVEDVVYTLEELEAAFPEKSDEKDDDDKGGGNDLLDRLPEYVQALIRDGEGLEKYGGDRSTSIFVACKEMAKALFTDDEQVAVLTDPANVLSAKALEKPDPRAWLLPQIGKARAEAGQERANQRETAGRLLNGGRVKRPAVDPVNPLSWTEDFMLTAEEAAAIADPRWIEPGLIVQGHVVAICSEPNGGKTTVFLYLAGKWAEQGRRVIYVNADTSASDAKNMAHQANRQGFQLLLPDMKVGLSMANVVQHLEAMAAAGGAFDDVVMVFDTLKKMTDVINKTLAKALYKTLRALSAKGMTIIILGHTNKYRGADGKPVYEGTGDLRADVDELVYLIPQKHEDGSMTVSTDPDKVRAALVPMTFEIAADRTVTMRDTYVDVTALLEQEQRLEKDQATIDGIITAINGGCCTQLDIIAHCKPLGLPKNTVTAVLRRYRGEHWAEERGLQWNRYHYRLIQKSAPSRQTGNWRTAGKAGAE